MAPSNGNYIESYGHLLVNSGFIFTYLVYLTETPVTETEIELKENIQKLLLDSIFHYNGLEVTKEIYLDYQEPYKLIPDIQNSEIIEDKAEAWSEDNLNSHLQCSNDDTTLTVLIKDELLSIGGIGTLMKKIKTKGIVR